MSTIMSPEKHCHWPKPIVSPTSHCVSQPPSHDCEVQPDSQPLSHAVWQPDSHPVHPLVQLSKHPNSHPHSQPVWQPPSQKASQPPVQPRVHAPPHQPSLKPSQPPVQLPVQPPSQSYSHEGQSSPGQLPGHKSFNFTSRVLNLWVNFLICPIIFAVSLPFVDVTFFPAIMNTSFFEITKHMEPCVTSTARRISGNA